MRSFEILTLAFLFLIILRLCFSRRSGWVELLPIVASLMGILQLVIEGYRWQMLPALVMCPLFLLISLPAMIRFMRKQPGIKKTPLALIVIAFILFIVSLALPILLPIPNLPVGGGPFKVGTFSMELTDSSRNELYSCDPNETRRIMVQVWYPAEPEPGNKIAPWMERADIVGPAISTYLKLPAFFLDHLKYAKTGAYLDAPVSRSEAPYPVLLFSHGWNGFRAQNTFQALKLASNGFVVAAIDHTYGAVVTVFPDGTIAYNNPEALPMDMPDAEYLPIANRLVEQWSGDLGFVLDVLKDMNENDPDHGLTDKLDLERVGVFGHSTGGGATVEFCGQDARCKAGIGMDAYLKPVAKPILEGGLTQPFLFMFSETWSSGKNSALYDQLAANSDETTTVSVLGTSHYDFSDLPMLTPLASALGLKGPLNGDRVMKIMGDYPLAFFNKQFYGINSPLLAGPDVEFPEVVFP